MAVHRLLEQGDGRQIVIDRPQTVRLSGLGPTVGRLDGATLLAVNRAMAVFFGLA